MRPTRLDLTLAIASALVIAACGEDALDTEADAGADTTADASDDIALIDVADDTAADLGTDTALDSATDALADTGADAIADAATDTVADATNDAVTDTATDAAPDTRPSCVDTVCFDGDACTEDLCSAGECSYPPIADADGGADPDGDFTCDLVDPDDDGDGLVDAADDCPAGAVGWVSNLDNDHDTDGCRDDDDEDSDDDNDGVDDSGDDCARGEVGWASDPTTDPDGDGCLNGVEDGDSDGDGVPDGGDSCADDFDWTSDASTDHDGDGCRNADPDSDDDNDGVDNVDDGCAQGELDWRSDAMTDLDVDGCRDDGEDTDDDDDGALDGEDCLPRLAAAFPGGTEVCDGIDNDCIGGTDNGVDFEFFADSDGDDFGDPASAVRACSVPDGHVSNADDCDDASDVVYPDAPEACDEERDCDPLTFEACPTVTTFADVAPIFRAYCSPCHSTGGSGGHNIAAANESTAYSASQLNSYFVPGETKGRAALTRILDGSMPAGRGCTGNPAMDAGNSNCLTAPQQALIQAWIDDGELR